MKLRTRAHTHILGLIQTVGVWSLDVLQASVSQGGKHYYERKPSPDNPFHTHLLETNGDRKTKKEVHPKETREQVNLEDIYSNNQSTHYHRVIFSPQVGRIIVECLKCGEVIYLIYDPHPLLNRGHRVVHSICTIAINLEIDNITQCWPN